MSTLCIAIVGSGGAGVVSLGELVLRTAAQQGYFGLMRKSFGPQIRGGESAAIIRLGTRDVANFDGDIQLLLAIDWNNFSRFGDEIKVTSNTVIVQDANAGALPPQIPPQKVHTRDFKGSAREAGSDKVNMAMLGFIGAWIGAEVDQIAPLIERHLSRADADIRQVNSRAMVQGFALQPVDGMPLLGPANKRETWIATGNQLAGLGALEAGVRFVAAYPITPASDCLEWIAGQIPGQGGHLVQAEDELSAINMIIGAGYAGVPAMTATSGPGLALMSEAMGLAVASETPIVVLNVMRGGPSTGIPTKSEQSDLNIALHGLHGDAPHIVLAALSIADCFHTMAWATELATRLQTLVIVLTDQFLAQSTQIIPPLNEVSYAAVGRDKLPDADTFARYELTDSGVSPVALPGDAGCMFTADGLEHTENAVPSPKASDHEQQLDKRRRKLENFDFGDDWAEVYGDGDNVLLCWGSVKAAALEAQSLLRNQGHSIKVVALRLLMPLPKLKLQRLCANAQRILLVEQNHQAQCAQYLRSLDQGFVFYSFARPGPTLITPQEIVDHFCALDTELVSGEQQWQV